MSEPRAPERPRQVTVAAGVAIGGSLLLVIALFDAMAQAQSVEMRDRIQSFVSTSPGNGLGLTVSGVETLLRGMVLFNGALAAAAAVLGVFILLRHNAARIAFTVAAGILLLTAPFSGGFLPIVIAFAATMLWTRPARDWFAGRVPSPPVPAAFTAPPTETPNAPPEQSAPVEPITPGPGSPSPPPSPYPFGQPGQQSAGASPTWAPQASSPQPAATWVPPPSNVDRRPASVTIAATITWAFGGVTLFVYLLVIVMMLAARDQLIAELRRNPAFRDLNIDTQDLLAALWVMSAIAILWCLVSMVLAFFAWRGLNWARIMLVVSAGVAGLVSGAAFPVGIVHMVGAIATVALLFSAGARQWYSRSASGPPPYPPSGPGPYGGQPPAPPQEKQPPSNVW